jgi:hypothetical protein
MDKNSNVSVIKSFFGNVTMEEFKKLSSEDRQELADLIRALPESDQVNS